ncbi:SgcJ/EcaC family oxidoreductase [Kitasatospora aureofaciens]|nr:SgcJ/EcaC family oxidoreductase [Kitasatospora aureofaciens]MBV6701706.1 SgcJ/EcaC family oxidoreductase [Kitasatospora aureofaciens]
MRRTYFAGVALAAAVVFTGTGATYATGTPAQHSAVTGTLQPPTKEQIAALFDQWNAALATGDANRVADLYAPDAVLLPTVSAEIRTDRAGIVDYFKHFLESKPVGRIQERFIDILDRTNAVDTGLYQFTLTNQDGSKTKVNARYTFVYELRGGTWLIINHHSSELPAG